MILPTLSYPVTTQNHRVLSYEVGSEESPRVYDASVQLSANEKDEIIKAAYRQIFHEQNMLENYRQPYLESQLRAFQLTVRDFVSELATSDAFLRLYYETNNNYRFVRLCIRRILGREVFHEREKMAWSTVIATQGVKSFINALVYSEEYEVCFGDSVVPYQRRRILPQQANGDLPFARLARYDQAERPELVTQPTGVITSQLENPGQTLLVAVLAALIFVALILVAGGDPTPWK